MSRSDHSRRTVLKGASLGMSAGLLSGFAPVVAAENAEIWAHEYWANKDGVKLNYADGSWILFRKSGTEPIIRIYCESPDAGRVQEMLSAAITELDR